VPRSSVVDASVAAKWYVPERGHDHAAALLEATRAGTAQLLAPDLIVAELGNALASRAAGGEITQKQAADRLSGFLLTPVKLEPSSVLAADALGVAARLRVTFYDALYLAAAHQPRAPLVSASEQLVRLVRRTGFERSAVRLADALV